MHYKDLPLTGINILQKGSNYKKGNCFRNKLHQRIH